MAVKDDLWQPIATAPKDGTRILVTCVEDDPEIVCWLNGGWFNGDSYTYEAEDFDYWLPVPASPRP